MCASLSSISLLSVSTTRTSRACSSSRVCSAFLKQSTVDTVSPRRTSFLRVPPPKTVQSVIRLLWQGAIIRGNSPVSGSISLKAWDKVRVLSEMMIRGIVTKQKRRVYDYGSVVVRPNRDSSTVMFYSGFEAKYTVSAILDSSSLFIKDWNCTSWPLIWRKYEL